MLSWKDRESLVIAGLSYLRRHGEAVNHKDTVVWVVWEQVYTEGCRKSLGMERQTRVAIQAVNRYDKKH